MHSPTEPSTFSTAERKPFKLTDEPSLRPSPCLNLKVFYVRLSNCTKLYKPAAPEHLSLNFIPLSPETMVEVNGLNSTTASVSSTLRRDRIDQRSEEAIFASTDSIRMTGSMRFEVYGRESLLLSGELELSMINEWSMKCQPVMSGGFYFLEGKKFVIISEVSWPAIEVYVTGFFSGSAVILTKTIYLGKKKKKKKKSGQMRVALDSVPEAEDEATGAVEKVLPMGADQQLMKYEGFGSEVDVDNNDYSSSMNRRSVEYIEVGNGELSWFNVGVGVGIGLSICLCIGVGTGLLLRASKTTARNFWRLL